MTAIQKIFNIIKELQKMEPVSAFVTDAPSGGVRKVRTEISDDPGDLVIQPLYTGICGTDRGIIAGSLSFSFNPPGCSYLVLGHEAICRVIESQNSRYRTGDIVIPMVRRKGKCINCRMGRQDNCSDGDKREAGITGKHGFMREVFTESSEYVVRVPTHDLEKVGVLAEPLKNVMKAFEVFDRVSQRSYFPNEDYSMNGKNAWIIGTGSEGFLYSMMAKEKGFETYITNRHPIDENRLKILESFGINFIDYSKDPVESIKNIDFLVDTSGDPSTVLRFASKLRQNGILILFGTNERAQAAPLTGPFIDHVVEKNISIVGSVDGAKMHYEQAVSKLVKWHHSNGGRLESLITGVKTPDDKNIFEKKDPNNIKTVISWQ